jgi:rod shape-determining protein MreC
MYDRQVRRRRAVLAGLVALSLLLLTFAFGESTGGVRSVQRGALQVLGPIQDGASRVLKPFRDLFGWVGDTVDAQQQRDDLVKERDALQRRIAKLEAAGAENEQFKQMLQINQSSLDRFEPVVARVASRSPNVFYSTLTINKGTENDVELDDPVVAANGALIGRVTEASGNYAIVTLITASDQDFAVGARTVGSNTQGAVQAQFGSRGDLILDPGGDPRDIKEGERVVTTGSLSRNLTSYYPPDITIGHVSRVDLGEGDLDREIHVKPSADLDGLLWVEVLTRDLPAQLQASTSATP